MKEYFTEALVLGVRPSGDYDKTIDLYTKQLGRVEAKVIGARKILSKLSPHLDLLNLILVRLVQKNQFIVADVVIEDRFSDLRRDIDYKQALGLVLFLRSLIPKAFPDLKLWYEFLRALRRKNFDYKHFLKILGYGPALASCAVCPQKKADYFYLADQYFLCSSCRVKFPENELVLLEIRN